MAGRFRKLGRKLVRAVKRRYLPKGKKGKTDFGKGLRNVVSDVRMLKSMVNAEKKRYSLASIDNGQTFGQVLGNNSGHFFVDITPLIPQGAGVSQRNGSSVKLHSAMMKFQLQQQTNTSSPIAGRVYIIAVKGSPIVPSDIGEFMVYNKWLFAQNAGATIYDTHSDRNQDYFKDYVVLASKRFYIRNDNISAQTMIRDINIPIKLGRHIKYNVDSTQVASGQLMMLWVADSGNCSPVASALLGIPQVSANTGLILRHDIQYYYYDN